MKVIDRTKNTPLAIFYLIVGMLIVGICIVGFVALTGATNAMREDMGDSEGLLLILFPVCFFISYQVSKFAFNRFINKGRQMLAPTAAEVLSKNPINPVLYLRSFKMDEAVSDNVVSLNSIAIPKPTEEMNIGHALNMIGPMVAIGDPMEELPKLGAARLYSTNEEWKDRFYELLNKCKHILWTVGVTPSVLWEFSQISSDEIFRKAIIYVPHRKMNQAQREDLWAGFRKHLADNYPHISITAPQTIGNTTFFVFDGQKNLVSIPSKKSLFSSPLDSGLKNLVKHIGVSAERVRAATIKSLMNFVAIIFGSIIISGFVMLALVKLATVVDKLIYPVNSSDDYYLEDSTASNTEMDSTATQYDGQSDLQEEMASFIAGEEVELPAYCTNTDDLNIRAKPSLEGEVLSEIPYLGNLTVKQRGPSATINGNANHWIYVEYDGVEGWVWGRWIKVGAHQ